MRVAIFDALRDLPASFPLLDFAILRQRHCPSKLELILGFRWAKLIGFLPPRLPEPIVTLRKLSLVILGPIFFVFELVVTMVLILLELAWSRMLLGKKSDVPENIFANNIWKGKSKMYKFVHTST
jgi:hypothetical protein